MHSMLTIGRLADYAGVSVRAVYFYHQKGLLAEPERDSSGYRRYGADAVVALIRIRTLAEAGVPLSRVQELLDADPDAFAEAVAGIDQRLRDEIRAKQEHRRRIARLAAGDSLALPPEAVAYLDRLRELGVPDRVVDLERDAWIIIAAQLPEQMPAVMALKSAQLESPAVQRMYRDLWDMVEWRPGDPRLPALADRIAAVLEATSDPADRHAFPLSDEAVALIDSVFVDHVPVARELLALLRERGWAGWTRNERVEALTPRR